MPPTETAEAPAKSPFATALEKAFTPAPKGEETPPPKKEVTPKEDAPADKKTSTPRDLFKKPDATTTTETKGDEPKSEFDDIAAPDLKDEKSKKGWEGIKVAGKKWETTAKTHEARVKELETKLGEYEPLKGQLAEREAKLKEYDEIVSRARIEDHPEFRKEFIDGREKIMARAKAIVEENGGDPKEIEKALNLKGRARVEAMRAVSEGIDNSYEAGRLGRAIDELDVLDERADAKRADAKKSYDELKEREKQRGIEEGAKRHQARVLEFDDTSRRLRGELEVLQKADGHDDWNARADKILKDARAHVEEHPDADPEAEILSRAVPAYRDLFLQADKRAEDAEKKVAAMEKELKAIHGKSPSLTSRTTTTAKAADGTRAKPFSEALNTAMNGEG